MSKALASPNPQNTSSTGVEIYGKSRDGDLRGFHSVLLEESLKAKRSTVEDDHDRINCHKFNNGNRAEKEFYSPGYPENYNKNVTCILTITGKNLLANNPLSLSIIACDSS
jgi:hypothetical protein